MSTKRKRRIMTIRRKRKIQNIMLVLAFMIIIIVLCVYCAEELNKNSSETQEKAVIASVKEIPLEDLEGEERYIVENSKDIYVYAINDRIFAVGKKDNDLNTFKSTGQVILNENPGEPIQITTDFAFIIFKNEEGKERAFQIAKNGKLSKEVNVEDLKKEEEILMLKKETL